MFFSSYLYIIILYIYTYLYIMFLSSYVLHHHLSFTINILTTFLNFCTFSERPNTAISLTSFFLSAHQFTSLESRSNAFFRSTNTMCNFLPAISFYFPGMNPICISSTFPYFQRLFKYPFNCYLALLQKLSTSVISSWPYISFFFVDWYPLAHFPTFRHFLEVNRQLSFLNNRFYTFSNVMLLGPVTFVAVKIFSASKKAFENTILRFVIKSS